MAGIDLHLFADSNDRAEVRFDDGRTLVVKRARHEWARARFAASHHASRLLREAGIPAPRPLALAAAEDGLPVEAYWKIELPTLAESWSAGRRAARQGLLRGWGRLARRIHRVAYRATDRSCAPTAAGWADEVLRGYGRALDPVGLAFFRAYHLANLGFHAALCRATRRTPPTFWSRPKRPRESSMQPLPHWWVPDCVRGGGRCATGSHPARRRGTTRRLRETRSSEPDSRVIKGSRGQSAAAPALLPRNVGGDTAVTFICTSPPPPRLGSVLGGAAAPVHGWPALVSAGLNSAPPERPEPSVANGTTDEETPRSRYVRAGHLSGQRKEIPRLSQAYCYRLTLPLLRGAFGALRWV